MSTEIISAQPDSVPAVPTKPLPVLMQYANGRKAGHYEPVLFRDRNGQVKVGHTGRINHEQFNPNIVLSVPSSGGLGCDTIPVHECFHAEDAFNALAAAAAPVAP